jgi:hypothetical protein
VYDLRQILSHIRIKFVRVNTGARQAACVQDLLNVFQQEKRRLLKKTSSEPTPPGGATTEGLTSPLSSSTSSESVVASWITADSSAASSRCQQGRLARPMSKKEVWALYGLKAAMKCAETGLVDWSSSEDEVQQCEAIVPHGSSGIAPIATTTTTQPTSEPTSTKSTSKPHYDAHLNAVVRITRDAQLEKALTQTGPNGFLIGNGTIFETEVPNLAMTVLPVKGTPKKPTEPKGLGKAGKGPQRKRSPEPC